MANKRSKRNLGQSREGSRGVFVRRVTGRKHHPKFSRPLSGEALSKHILAALENKKYFARTFDGIARDVGVKRSEILKKIKSDQALREKIKVFRRKSQDGKLLLTTKSRFTESASFTDKFIDIFSSKGVDFDNL
ncbi:hypothetical protein [Microbulbifer zhoushanensis]|uniref:hypothetical protein n=1 Tax=Microbulbifer TaxID=48073 RepID=UPI001F36162E|nr:hypothetical protein [Microbulbifer zhoushanensis]